MSLWFLFFLQAKLPAVLPTHLQIVTLLKSSAISTETNEGMSVIEEVSISCFYLFIAWLFVIFEQELVYCMLTGKF